MMFTVLRRALTLLSDVAFCSSVIHLGITAFNTCINYQYLKLNYNY